MAPELRSRKASGTAKAPAAKPKAAAAPKRKAAEDVSPVAPKKKKAVDSTPVPKKATKASKSKKEPEPEPEQTPEDDDQPFSEEEEEEEKQILKLAGVDGDDDEDDEADETLDFKDGDDVGTIPAPPPTKKGSKSNDGEKGETGVVYIGHIPHGFFENQLRSYFTQFGDILNLRVSRNKKTGRSKHYAFIEFAEESTADYVVKSMDNYLMFGRILKVKRVPQSQVHESMWTGSNRRFKAIPHTKLAGNQLKKPKTETQWAEKVDRVNKKRADQAAKLKALGYEFDTPELKAPSALTGEEEAPEAIEAAPEPVEAVAEEVVAPKATKAKARKGGKAKKSKA
ncbi:RNA binding protein [Apiospora marii]|uniref:RNA binding protein n=1 Tax=Apiospora marii TaxID=335849 RepID=A0ABR1RAG2_9PEZI